MRKLMWLGSGFAAACLVGAYLLSGIWLALVGVLTLALAVTVLLIWKKNKRAKIAALLLIGFAVGGIWFCIFTSIKLAPAQRADGESLVLEAEATDYSYDTDYGIAVEASISLEGKRFNAKLYFDAGQTVEPGDRIKGEFRLRFTGPEGEESSTYLSGAGIHLLGYGKGDVTVEHMGDTSLRHFPARVRHAVLDKIEEIFPADVVPFAKALILGDRYDMSYELETELTTSGIIHLVAVSGLHVSVLFSLLFLLLGSRRVLTPLVGTAFLVFVAAVSGFTPSIVRACLMNGLMLFALFSGREPDSPTALAFAVMLMLGFNPLCVTSVGLQLSVASVIGILLFAQRISGWIQDLPVWGDVRRRTVKHYVRSTLAASLSVTLAATVTTAPLTAAYFGTVSLVGMLTNLLTVGIANIVFAASVAAVVLAFLWVTPAKLVVWVLAWGMRYIMLVAQVLSGFPLAAVYTESVYITVWLVGAYLLIALFLIFKGKHPWILGGMLVGTLAFSVLLSWLEPKLDSLRITAVDVGQGQCIILQSDGRTYMVDCGGDTGETAADAAAEVLLSQGIFHLDGLVITHYDEDHVSGAPYLLSRIPADTLYLPKTPGWESWTDNMIANTDGQVCWLTEDTSVTWDNTQMRLICSDYTESSNESSLCVLYQNNNCDILITGDRTAAGEADLLLDGISDIDILVAGHHGAATSTSSYLLKMTRPELVLISAGKDNRYNHPSQAVLERLVEFGCAVLRTDVEGTITLRR